MGKSRYITFGTFLIGGIVLILCSQFLKSNFYLASALCFVLAVVTFVSGILDKHLNDYLKVTILVIGLLFLIAFAVGPLVTEENLSLFAYCLIFSILEIINAITELNEAVVLFKHKSYLMGVLFTIDALFELILGILLIIEGQHALRTHVILISIDLFFEGTIKLINSFLEDKREEHAK